MDAPPQPLSFPALVIDGSGSSVFVGVLNASPGWLAWQRSHAPPLESLFPTVEQVLRDAKLDLSGIACQIYAAGPGSVLGLRLCAMALETWGRLYPASARRFAYNSLQLAAAQILPGLKDGSRARIISDWRRDLWNSLLICDGRILEPAPIATADLTTTESENLFHLPARKGWQQPPAGARSIELHPENLPQLLNTPGLLRPTQNIELYTSGTNQFQKWTPQRHRA